MSRLLRPVLAANGGNVNNAASLVLPYGTNQTGDMFRALIHCMPAGTSVPAAPNANWVLVDSFNVGGDEFLYIFDRVTRSSGNEAGTETFTIAAGNFPNQGVILTYRNVRLGDYTESLVQSTAAGAGPTSLGGPTIVSGGPGRLAVAYAGSNGIGAPLAIAAPPALTGGAWQARFTAFSGLGGTYTVQDAALASGGTVAGGAVDMPGTQTVMLAHALLGQSQRQATASFHVASGSGDMFAFVTCPLEGARVGDTYTFAPYNVGIFSAADTSSVVELFCAADDVVTAKFITTNPTGFDTDEDWILALGLPDT